MLNSALLRIILQSNESRVYAGDAISFSPNIDITHQFVAGDGTAGLEAVGVKEVTVGTSAADVDLLTSLSPFGTGSGSTVPFNGIRGILFQNTHATASLSIGKGTTNAWAAPFPAGLAAGTLIKVIRPGQAELWTASDLPWLVSGALKTISALGTTAGTTGRIWIFGNVA